MNYTHIIGSSQYIRIGAILIFGEYDCVPLVSCRVTESDTHLDKLIIPGESH